MGWVLENLQNENVRSIIVAGKFDDKLFHAQKVIKNVEVFIYEVNIRLNEYKKTRLD